MDKDAKAVFPFLPGSPVAGAIYGVMHELEKQGYRVRVNAFTAGINSILGSPPRLKFIVEF